MYGMHFFLAELPLHLPTRAVPMKIHLVGWSIVFFLLSYLRLLSILQILPLLFPLSKACFQIHAFALRVDAFFSTIFLYDSV